GDFGGLVFRDDPNLALPGDIDAEAQGIFLNYVNHANISYGGGQVVVNGVLGVYDPITLLTVRPTITFSRITNSSDAAISADPNSFKESEFADASYQADYTRGGPEIHGNTLASNSINGLFVRIVTPNQAGLNTLTT